MLPWARKTRLGTWLLRYTASGRRFQEDLLSIEEKYELVMRQTHVQMLSSHSQQVHEQAEV